MDDRSSAFMSRRSLAVGIPPAPESLRRSGRRPMSTTQRHSPDAIVLPLLPSQPTLLRHFSVVQTIEGKLDRFEVARKRTGSLEMLQSATSTPQRRNTVILRAINYCPA